MKILHTMIRVYDLEKSLHFYQEVLGMQLLKLKEYKEQQFTLAFLGYEAMEKAACIELTYNWDQRSYEMGTAFGHLAIGVEDIYAFCEKLEKKGVEITRKPGPMKGGETVIAFIKDPDGYSIELIQSS